jgi:hypothetical protein
MAVDDCVERLAISCQARFNQGRILQAAVGFHLRISRPGCAAHVIRAITH